MRAIITTTHGTRREAFGPTEWLVLSAIAILYGTSFLFIAIGLDSLRRGLVTLLRVAISTIILAAIPRARRSIGRHDRIHMLVLGMCWIGVPYILLPVAQQWIDSSRAGMITGSVPLFTAVLSGLLLRSKPPMRQTLGLSIGFAGAVLVSLPQSAAGAPATLGVLLTLATALLWAIALNMTVPLQQAYGSLSVVFWAHVVSIPVIVPAWLLSATPGSRQRACWPSSRSRCWERPRPSSSWPFWWGERARLERRSPSSSAARGVLPRYRVPGRAGGSHGIHDRIAVAIG